MTKEQVPFAEIPLKDITISLLIKRGIKWVYDRTLVSIISDSISTEPRINTKIKLGRDRTTPCPTCRGRNHEIIRGAGFITRSSYLLEVMCKGCKEKGVVVIDPKSRVHLMKTIGSNIEWSDKNIVPRC